MKDIHGIGQTIISATTFESCDYDLTLFSKEFLPDGCNITSLWDVRESPFSVQAHQGLERMGDHCWTNLRFTDDALDYGGGGGQDNGDGEVDGDGGGDDDCQVNLCTWSQDCGDRDNDDDDVSDDDDGEYDCQVDLCKKRKFHEKFGGHHYFLRWYQ